MLNVTLLSVGGPYTFIKSSLVVVALLANLVFIEFSQSDLTKLKINYYFYFFV